LSNWIELAALLLIIAAGIAVWLVCRARLRRHEGFEGIIKEKNLPSPRRKMDVEEEIEYLEQLLAEEQPCGHPTQFRSK